MAIGPPNLTTLRPPETPKSRRHGAPAGPWPWTDFDEIFQEDPSPRCTEEPGWMGYPQSLFPNWSPAQVKRSGIQEAASLDKEECVIRRIDINNRPPFKVRDDDVIRKGEEQSFWEKIQEARPPNVKARALFLDRPSGAILKMIGAKYTIEPFFFSSSLNRIPSRYQEDNRGKDGDHITIILSFLRIVRYTASPVASEQIILPLSNGDHPQSRSSALRNKNFKGYLELDLLAIHMVGTPQSSTIISYHPEDSRATAAEHLQSRVVDAGHSVYWTNILANTSDPTFILLIYLWYALYAWDQALENLYAYISDIEINTIRNFDTQSAQTLHTVHSHLLSYASILKDFEKSVQFVLLTSNPTMEEASGIHESERLQVECNNILSEIGRLEMGRYTHTERLRNAMNLLFSSVNIHDSEQMRKLTSVAVRDSRTMKQVSILTMVFLPASFAATVFGMNIKELDDNTKGSLTHYVEAAIPLTALTVWIVVASQTTAPGSHHRMRGWEKLAWPFRFLWNVIWVFSRVRPEPQSSDIDLELP